MRTFSIHRMLLTFCLGALILTGCMPPPARSDDYVAPEIHRAPAIARPLAPDGARTEASGATSPYVYSARDDETLAAPDARRIVKIGLLLPLSGRSAELGKTLQDAATLSLFDKYARLSNNQQAVRVELLPKDTGDTPEQAVKAMEQALAEGAEFIIGPLFADATAASAPLARVKNIAVLSFSSNRAQASAGTYAFGFSPTDQTERVVNYALRHNKPRIAVLIPSTPLGEAVLTAARETVNKQGLKLAGEAKYMAQGTGLDTALNILLPPGQPRGFDAILIPESGPTLSSILRGLSARGVTPQTVQFLGTGLWDDAELLHRVNLETAWLASSPPDLTRAFEQRFVSTYRYTPQRIASLAYDAVALAVTLAVSERPFDAATLANGVGFAGPANGIFRLRPNGAVQRGLAVLQVEGGGLTVIAPPPSGF